MIDPDPASPSSIHVPNLAKVAISPRGSFIVTASQPAQDYKRKKVTLAAWDTRDGNPRFVKDDFGGPINSMQISPDDKYIALTVGGAPPVDYVRNAGPKPKDLFVSIRDAKTGGAIKSKRFPRVDNWCMGKFIDSHRFIFAEGGTLHSWMFDRSGVTEEAALKLPFSRPQLWDISKDGKALLIGYNSAPPELYKYQPSTPCHTLALADASTGKVLHFQSLQSLLGAGFSRKGDWFYVTENRIHDLRNLSWIPYVCVYDTASRKKLWERKIPLTDSLVITPSRDGRSLDVETALHQTGNMSVSTIHAVLDSRTGEPLVSESPYQDAISAGFAYTKQPDPLISDNGRVMISSSENEITIWNRDDDYCIWDSC